MEYFLPCENILASFVQTLERSNGMLPQQSEPVGVGGRLQQQFTQLIISFSACLNVVIEMFDKVVSKFLGLLFWLRHELKESQCAFDSSSFQFKFV